MADFKTAVLFTLKNEGGYVDNPHDPGGKTKYGITQRDLPGKDIESLTEDEAIDYYSEHYWKTLYSQIASQDVASKLFDMGVLFGIGEAVYLLQRALSFIAPLSKVFDNDTLTAVNLSNPADLLKRYKAHLQAHAMNIANATPSSRIFLTGWLNRINS